jgi:hypothetical protein
MSNTLNEIHLNNAMIASLYGHSIVPAGQASEQPNIPYSKKIKFLGNNSAQITMLVSNPSSTFVTDEELVFLTKMLSACNLTISDVAIVNVATSNLDDVIRELKPSRIISFLDPDQYSLQKIKNIQLIEGSPLDQFIKDTPEARQLKTRLWAHLRKMFSM